MFTLIELTLSPYSSKEEIKKELEMVRALGDPKQDKGLRLNIEYLERMLNDKKD